MQKMKRMGMVAAAASFALMLAACGGSDNGNGAEPEAPANGETSEEAGGEDSGDAPYIAIVSKGFQHQFWQAVKDGAEDQAETEGATITFEGPASEADVEDQITMLTNALAKKPDAIGFAALDSKAAEPLLQQAEENGIPVIAFDSGVDSDIPLTTASTDNKAAAAEAAKHMSELVGGEGQVAMVVHDQTSGSGIERRDGFIEWMEENAPDIELLDPQYGGGDHLKSADITKAILASNPDVVGIYGSNEGSAIGVITGVEESGVEGVSIVGFDSGKAQIDAIKDGSMAGAITQNPVGIGEEVVKAAMMAINGEDLPELIDTGFYWYDQSNIDDPEIQAVIYE